MKNNMVSVVMIITLGFVGAVSADDVTLMDLINKKTDKINVIAESSTEQLIKVGAAGGSLFGDSDDKEALIEYCNYVGGVANLSQLDSNIYEPLFLSRHTNMDCKAPNGKSFTATFIRSPYSSNKGFQNAWLDVKYETPQTKKYYMQNYIKRFEPGNDPEKLKNGRGNYYTIENGMAMCEQLGGKYLMATEESQGYAIIGSEYYFAIAHKLGNFKNEYSIGKHWCVNTTEKEKEFTVESKKEITKGAAAVYEQDAFYPSKGVDHSQIKISNDPVPPYYMKGNAGGSHVIHSPSSPVGNSVAVGLSGTVTPADVALAEKTIAAQNTTLERRSGYTMEGMYLGVSSDGCQIAAVAKSGDKPYGHKHLFGKNDNSDRVMNFKQCKGYGVEFIGDSLERSFPKAIATEYERVLDMCKVRGNSMGSNLGYNIDCARLGTVMQPIYEMTVTKKEKFVLRTLEK